MNLVRARRAGAAALLAFLLSAGPSLADVKLRIYLQDGALQAGTLVTETEKSFVILTSEGRVEVPKNSIMFINGKTLKQWQDRPDKLFQTEIMPSDVPDPSFVNDKSLPPAPPVPSQPVSAKAAAIPKAAPHAPIVKPVPPLVAAPEPEKKKEPEAVPAKPAAKPIEKAAEKPAPHSRADRRVARTRSGGKTDAVHPVAVHAAESPVVAANVKGSAPAPNIPAGIGRFDRTSAGAAHRLRGQEFNRVGEKGRAIQEYQIARLLEPSNPENPLELGRLYLEQGLSGEASRHFSNPLLRKSAEAKDQIEKIAKSADLREEKVWQLRAAAAAGCFGWLPIIVGMRLLRRRRKASTKTTILADDLRAESALSSPVPAPAKADTSPAFDETVEMPALAMPEPPAFLSRQAPVEEPALFFQPPLEEVFEPLPLVDEQPIYEHLVPVEEPAMEPVMDEPVEREIPAARPEIPQPAFASEANIPPPDPQEILSVARTMEVSLIRGNQYAIDGHFEESRRAYRTALALNPSCTSAHLGLGYLSFAEEKWEIALLHYRKALDIDPGSADAHYGVARVLLEVNRVEDALPELRATLQIDPTYDDARDTLTALSKPA